MLKKVLFILIILPLIHSYGQGKENRAIEEVYHITDTISYDKAIIYTQNLIRTATKHDPMEYVNKLIESGEKLAYNNGLAKACILKGRIYKSRAEYPLALQSQKQALSYFQKNKNKKGVAIVHNEMYTVEFEMGNLEKSAYYLLESRKYFEIAKDTGALKVICNNLGLIYISLKDYDASKEALQKAILLNKSSGKKDGMLSAPLNNLANVYLKQKEFEKAIHTINEAIQINKEYNKSQSLGISYSILAEIYRNNKEYKKAKIYNDSTMYIFRNETSNVNNIQAKQRSGIIEFKLGNYEKAEKMLTEARKGFDEINSELNLLENYKLSSTLDSLRGNIMDAFVWKKKYQTLSDKRLAKISTKKLENAEARYKAEIAQLKRIDAQNKREQKRNAELYKYRVFTFIILGFLMISLFILIKVNRVRKEKKMLIKKLNESNQVKNKLFSTISHDLKNEVFELEVSLNMIKNDKISLKETEEIIPVLANRINQTSVLLNNLLNWSKSQMKELHAKPVVFDVTEVIASKFTFFKPKAIQKNIELINKLEETEIYADVDMISIVAQNLIANAIKFCEPGDTISLISREKEDHYEIGFVDTGIGIAPSDINKLFAEEAFTTYGTKNESGTGLGLKICKELIELNKGDIKVESTLGKGSTFLISLPKSAA